MTIIIVSYTQIVHSTLEKILSESIVWSIYVSSFEKYAIDKMINICPVKVIVDEREEETL